VLVCALIACASVVVNCEAQPAQQPAAKAGDKAKQRAGDEALKKYAGRYELEVGIIPISTLDVRLADGELWVKPTNAKKRRLLRKSKNVFTDEVEGTPVRFNRDDEGRFVSLTFEFEDASYTAQRVELPPPSLKGNVVFRLKGNADASVVAVAGTFNNWNQSQILFAREGDEWVCRIDLDPGVYQYKLIVDGDWLLDPSNPDTAEDEAGNRDWMRAMERAWSELQQAGPEASHDAHFACALSLAWPNDGQIEGFEGRVDGTLVWPPRGDKGFGYDPMFVPAGHERTFGEMDPAEKHTISHRARAFEKLVAALR